MEYNKTRQVSLFKVKLMYKLMDKNTVVSAALLSTFSMSNLVILSEKM